MFNWFNRKFRNKEDSQTQPPSEAQESVSQEEKKESATVESEDEKKTEESSQEDVLKWAKAAYQNIQKRQEEETQEEETQEEVTQEEVTQPEATQEEETQEEETQEEETQEEVTQEEVTQPEATQPEATPEEPETSIEEDTSPSETVEETPVEASQTPVEAPEPEKEPEPAETAATEPQTAMPAWMKKSDGLERLKETAIEEEEEEEPELDENFVWSAKVLAEQGRSPEDVSFEEISWLKQLREGLGKTRRSLVNQLKSIVGQGPLNDDAVMEIEALLLQADVGVEATDYIIETLQNKLREEALPPEEAIAYLKQILCDLLDKPLPDPANAALVPEIGKLNVWLMTGVNGAGKTTTIGKLAHMGQKSGYSCLIAAADTFRAAAVEQVKVWGERSKTTVIANPGKNTDPAAVVFDAIAAAKSRETELLLVDTAGRLQNKKNLMEELTKIRRIIDKKAPEAVVESLLVLDATLGQNGLQQAKLFSESAKLSGVVLTKLDGTAKGGVALAVTQQLNLPIRFIGAGEGIEDLRPFSSYEFVEALLSE